MNVHQCIRGTQFMKVFDSLQHLKCSTFLLIHTFKICKEKNTRVI